MSIEDIDIEMTEVEERIKDLMRRYQFLKNERFWKLEEIEKAHDPV